MALTRSFIRNAATTPTDARVAFLGLVVANADGSPRPGVLGGANVSIVSTLASMNVAIAAAEFVTTKGRADGVAVFGNDGTVNVPIPIAPTSNSRIDVIYVKHNDNTTGDAISTPVFAVASGAAAASPVKPSIPTGALELATLRVYSGTTATNGAPNTLVNTYQMTAPRGSTVHFRTKADLDLWVTAVDGQAAFTNDDGRPYLRYGGAWILVFAPLKTGVLGADGNGSVAWAELTKDKDGWVDLTARTDRTNGTTYAANRILGVLPAGFRPINDAVGEAVTYGSGTNIGMVARSSTGICELHVSSPAGHTAAIIAIRFKGTP